MVEIYKNIDTMVVFEKKKRYVQNKIRADIHLNHTNTYQFTEEEVNTILRAFKLLDDKKFINEPQKAEGWYKMNRSILVGRLTKNSRIKINSKWDISSQHLL